MRVSPERFDLRSIAPQPWKNGAGVTREIASGGASSAAFDWRISVAEVEHDSPFSTFPGIDRCIVLLRGEGMQLRSNDGAIDHALAEAHAPFRFSGDVALNATLIDGASSDFNLMTRRGVFRSEVSCERSATLLTRADVTLVLCSIGIWRMAGDDPAALGPMQALLWRAPVTPRRVEPVNDNSVLLVVRLCHDRPP